MTVTKIKEANIVLELLARYALLGDPEGRLLYLRNIPEWVEKHPQHWKTLQNFSFRDLWLKMTELHEASKQTEELEEDIIETPSSTPEPEKTMTETKTPKATTENRDAHKATILSIPGFSSPGDEMGRKQIIEASGLSEHHANEALTALKAEGHLQAGKGRGAKWKVLSLPQ